MFLAIATALPAFISLATEMGRIDRVYYFLVSPNPASPMFWMSAWYAADVFIILLEYANIRRNRHSRRIMWAAFFVAVATYGTLGSLFGAVSSRAYYYGALLPVYFLFVAFLSGGAPVFRAYDIPEVVRYSPSVFEVLVVVASVSLVSCAYLVCDRSGLFETVPGKEA
jgi:molybdopterin-containing oxidoreductase family membrane subunit